MDVKLTGDCIHWGAGQIFPTTRRVTHGCLLGNKPWIFEQLVLFSVFAHTHDHELVYEFLIKGFEVNIEDDIPNYKRLSIQTSLSNITYL